MSDFLTYEQDGAVVTLTMNQPDARNPLSGESQYEAFLDATDRISRDDDVKCVILTGAGSAFSAGGNVKDMRDRKGLSEGGPYQIRNNYKRDIHNIPLTLYNLEVPTIAAVNGAAVGAGCDLACMCDIRIGSEKGPLCRELCQAGHHLGRWRRLSAAQAGRHVESRRDDLHRRHDRRRGSPGHRPDLESGAP